MNPIVINSNTGSTTQFGFEAIFDIFNSRLSIDVSELTIGTYTSISFSVKDGFGNELNTNPPLTGSTTIIYIDIPNGAFKFAEYTIKGVLTDTDAKTYSIEVKKDVCKPKNINNDVIKGVFTHTADCKKPQLTINDSTVYVYNGKTLVSKDKNYAIRLPNQDLETVKNISATPIVMTELYSGDYLVKGYTDALFDLDDNVFVLLRYEVSYLFNLTCDDRLCEVICCVEKLQSDIDNCNSSTAELKSLKAKRDKAYPLMFQALALASCGKSNASKVNEIKRLLNCECSGCDSNTIEGQPILIQTQNSYAFSSDCFDVSVVGGVTNISCKGVSKYILTKLESDCEDLLTISKSTLGNTVTYSIGVNCDELRSYIKNLLTTDDDIINIINQNFNLNNQVIQLDKKCLDLSVQSDYITILCECDEIVFAGIKINGVVNSPLSTLYTNDTVGILSYLNGLGLGLFSVVSKYDVSCSAQLGGCGTQLEISSLNNSNTLEEVICLKNGTQTFTSTFSVSNSVRIQDWIQAVTDKLCDLCFEDVSTCEEMTICSLVCEKRAEANVDFSIGGVYVYLSGSIVSVPIEDVNGYRLISAGVSSVFAVGCDVVIASAEQVVAGVTTPIVLTSIWNGSSTIFNFKQTTIVPIGTSLSAVMAYIVNNDCAIIEMLTRQGVTYEDTETVNLSYDEGTKTLTADVEIEGLLLAIRNNPIYKSIFCDICPSTPSGVPIQLDSNAFVNTIEVDCIDCSEQYIREVLVNGVRMMFLGCTGVGETIDATGGESSEQYGLMVLNQNQTYQFDFRGFAVTDCTPTVVCAGEYQISFYDSSNVQIGTTLIINLAGEAMPDCNIAQNITIPSGAIRISVTVI